MRLICVCVHGVLPDRREEDEKREANRRAFDEMVERARQQPPEPHDPMRFRAVPPGRVLAKLCAVCCKTCQGKEGMGVLYGRPW